MSVILEGLARAVELIASGDPTVLSIAARSIYVSGSATLLASAWSLPIGAMIGMSRFRGRGLVKGFFNSLIGLPTVALGLILYLLLSKSGPLGALELLYSNTAIIIGQSILITPLIVSFTMNAVESVDPDIRRLAKTLGAGDLQASLTVVREALGGVVLAVLASFNRAIAELGIALMVGGNIRGVTRVLTTTIALETTRGEIALGIALTLILLIIIYSISIAANLVIRR